MIEEELIVLEKYADHLIDAYNDLVQRHEQLKQDYAELNQGQGAERAKNDSAKAKIENLINKLRKIENAHER